MTSDLLSSIDASDERSWTGKVFPTLDLDWAPDEMLDHAVELLEANDLKCTLFVTHDSPAVSRLKTNPNWELGLHPVFDVMTSAAFDHPSSLDNLRTAFPRATAIRSHSLVQSSRLHNRFASLALTHESNTYVPASAGIPLRPWRIWNGLVRVPFVWADDIYLYNPADAAVDTLKSASVCVVAFHPVHLYLNTDSVETYESFKAAQQRGEPAAHLVNRTRRGIRDVFVEMMSLLA